VLLQCLLLTGVNFSHHKSTDFERLQCRMSLRVIEHVVTNLIEHAQNKIVDGDDETVGSTPAEDF